MLASLSYALCSLYNDGGGGGVCKIGVYKGEDCCVGVCDGGGGGGGGMSSCDPAIELLLLTITSGTKYITNGTKLGMHNSQQHDIVVVPTVIEAPTISVTTVVDPVADVEVMLGIREEKMGSYAEVVHTLQLDADAVLQARLLKPLKLKTQVTFLLWVASESLFLAFLPCHHLFSTFRMA
ncbi:hypothetical protein Tco_1097472 [Tanacetum coccineum]